MIAPVDVPGKGLAQGLAVTWQHLTRRSVTQQYPDVLPQLPPRSRGVIALFEENCTVCMLCARECPDWCIYIDSHKEVIPATEPGARDRTRNVLDRFAIDFSLCMYCGICIEVCPFDALFWSPEFEYSELDIRDLTHEKDRLRDWMWTVPPPPAPDPAAEEPKEVALARAAIERAGAAGGKAAEGPARRRPAAEGPDRRRPAGEGPAGGRPAHGGPDDQQSDPETGAGGTG
jgi:NADH-quinone oxidoreductase subunit I